MVRGQQGAGFGVIVLVIIIAAIAGFLYFEGYLSFPPSGGNSQQTGSPVSLNASVSGSSQLYANQPFSVVTYLSSSSSSPINVSVLPFGCSFLPLQKRYVVLYPHASQSVSWTFSSSSPVNCNMEFVSCFSYNSSANYQIAFENYNYSGSVPTAPPTFSTAPVSLALSGLSNPLILPANAQNVTVYLSASKTASGNVQNSTLNWLALNTAGLSATIYFEEPNGVICKIPGGSCPGLSGSVLNMSGSQYGQYLGISSKINIPFFLSTPKPLPSGFSTGNTIAINAGYTFCVNSNVLSVNIQS